jgi:hypothetical protein
MAMRAQVAMVAVIVACVASPTTAGVASMGAPPAVGVSMQSARPAAAARIAHGAAKSGGLLASRDTAAARHATARFADVRRCA